jgi:hypothetical protein
LYDYGARFYSALTGRFLSPDPLVAKPGDPQMLNRYAYVRDNPLVYIDPSGLDMVIVCGLGQNCEGKKPSPDTIEQYKQLVITYWLLKGHVPLEVVQKKWDLFLAFVAYGADPKAQLEAGGVAFLTTSANVPSVGKQYLWSGFQGYVDKLSGYVKADPEIDTLVGFSERGFIVSLFLREIVRTSFMPLSHVDLGDWTPQSVLLIEPGFSNPGPDLGNPLTDVDVPQAFPGTRFATWNGEDSEVHGEVKGTMSFWSGECGGTHCPHSTTAWAALAVTLFPAGSQGEQDYLAVASALGGEMAIAR